MSSRTEPKPEQVPGCFDIIRRGNVPGISFSSTLAHPPSQQSVQASVTPQMAFNQPPFPAEMKKATFNGVDPQLPTFQTFCGYHATFTNVGHEEFNAQVWTKGGPSYLTVYPYYDQFGRLCVTTWVTNYPIRTNKKQMGYDKCHAKARGFASPAKRDDGAKLVWEAKEEDITEYIKK